MAREVFRYWTEISEQRSKTDRELRHLHTHTHTLVSLSVVTHTGHMEGGVMACSPICPHNLSQLASVIKPSAGMCTSSVSCVFSMRP